MHKGDDMPTHRQRSNFNSQLRRIGFTSYKGYLASSHWKAFCQEYIDHHLLLRCIGCDTLEYILHHVTYKRLGGEDLGDVIPLCNTCHLGIHRMHKRYKIPLIKPEIALQTLYAWSDDQRDRRFSYKYVSAFLERRRRDLNGNQEVKLKPRGKSIVRNRNDFYRVAKHKSEIREYLRTGYTLGHIAQIYKIKKNYISCFIADEPDYFAGIRVTSNKSPQGLSNERIQPMKQNDQPKPTVRPYHELDKYRQSIKLYVRHRWTCARIARTLHVSEEYVKEYIDSDPAEFGEWAQKK